jgi:hypothetical protein
MLSVQKEAMNTDERLSELQAKRRMLLQQLATPMDFRPGSLVARFRKCGRPYCHCAHDGSQGHGPSWSLTRPINGKTITKIIPKEAVEQTKAQIVGYHHFQGAVHELIETNVQICDALLELRRSTSEDAGTAEDAEKGGSGRKSTPPFPMN